MKKYIIMLLATLMVVMLMATSATYHKVDPDKCIGCTLCVQKCPVKAITMVDGKAIIDREKCIQCGLCVKACPVAAISVVEETAAADTTAAKPDSTSVPVEKKTSSVQVPAQEEEASKLYAVQEDKCIGCKICKKKCPTGAISMKQGIAQIDQGKCIQCGICDQACPVDAIAVEVAGE